MKIRTPLTLSLVLAAFSLPSLAHDPKLHQQEGTAAPDCSQMTSMDMSKMDMNDPVMKAMQQKCKDQVQHDNMKDHGMKGMPGMDKMPPPPADQVKP